VRRHALTYTVTAPRVEDPMRKGHCLCGAIQYETAATPTLECICHCTMCRRAAGSPMVGWFTVPRGTFRVLSGTPARYQSSPHAARRAHVLRRLRHAAHVRIAPPSRRDGCHHLFAGRSRPGSTP